MDKHKGEQNIIQTIIKTAVFFLILTIQILIIIFIYNGTSNLKIYAEAIFDFIKLCYIVYIVYRPINPSYKIIWIILIALLPVLGIVLFTLYGNNKIPRRVRKKLEKNMQESEQYLTFKKENYMILKEIDIYKYRQACFLTNVTDFPLYRSNKIEYLNIGETYFEKLLADLKKAEKYIFIEYFIIAKGEMWDELFNVLKERADCGVKIYIITDQFGSMFRLPENFKENFNLENIKTKIFGPIVPFLTIHMNHRDHRKIVVIDGKIAYTGGINIGDEYINKNSRLGHFKDFGVRVTGMAVKNFIIMFLRMWNMGDSQEFLDYKNYIPNEPNYPNDDNGFLLPFSDGPDNINNPAENTYINMINSAKKSIYITTPYLILDNEMVTSLTNAVNSGIDVRIIIPHIPDKKIVFALSRSFYDKLLKSGVKIFEYEKGFIHGKTCIVDGEVAINGTINFDFRSLYLHYECGVWSYNTGEEKKMQDDFLKTQEISIQIKYENWKKRFILKKIFEAILVIVAPLL